MTLWSEYTRAAGISKKRHETNNDERSWRHRLVEDSDVLLEASSFPWSKPDPHMRSRTSPCTTRSRLTYQWTPTEMPWQCVQNKRYEQILIFEIQYVDDNAGVFVAETAQDLVKTIRIFLANIMMCFRRRRLPLNFGHGNPERMLRCGGPQRSFGTLKKHAETKQNDHGKVVRKAVPGCLVREAKALRADAAHGSVCTIQKKIMQKNEVQIDVRIVFACSPSASRLMFGVVSWSCVDVASALIFDTQRMTWLT